MKNATPETFKLISVQDLRPINWFSGKRESLPAGEGNVCDRCGARHAVVYTFEGNRGTTMRVGSTCATKDLGLGVTKRELARAEREAFTTAQEAEMARQVEAVKWAIRSAGSTPVAQLLETTTEAWGTREKWGADGVTVWCFEGFTHERARCFASSWLDKKIRAAVQFTPGFNEYEVIARAKKEMGYKS